MPFITRKMYRNNYSKCSVFASSALSHLFFTSNSVVFVDRGRKIIPCPRAQGTLATPLKGTLRQDAKYIFAPPSTQTAEFEVKVCACSFSPVTKLTFVVYILCKKIFLR